MAGTSPAAQPVPSEPDGVEWTVDNLVPSPHEFLDSLTEQNYPFIADQMGLSKLSYWLFIYAKAVLAALDAERRRCAALEAELASWKSAYKEQRRMFAEWLDDQGYEKPDAWHDDTARPGGGAQSGEG